MIKRAAELPAPGFTTSELEDYLGYKRKSLFPAIRRGALRAYKDSSGQMRISYPDAVLFAQWRLDYLKQHGK